MQIWAFFPGYSKSVYGGIAAPAVYGGYGGYAGYGGGYGHNLGTFNIFLNTRFKLFLFPATSRDSEFFTGFNSCVFAMSFCAIKNTLLYIVELNKWTSIAGYGVSKVVSPVSTVVSHGYAAPALGLYH